MNNFFDQLIKLIGPFSLTNIPPVDVHFRSSFIQHYSFVGYFFILYFSLIYLN